MLKDQIISFALAGATLTSQQVSFVFSVCSLLLGGFFSPAGFATPAHYQPEIIDDVRTLGGYTELIPYVLPSPHQEDAGSCLYMSLTGIAEWWLARLRPDLSRALNGPVDLSERFLINASGLKKYTQNVVKWQTDSIEIFNAAGRSVLNRNYPFTKGWYREDSEAEILPAQAGRSGSKYGVIFNWFDDLKSLSSGFVKLPQFSKNVLYADPASDAWNVGLNPPEIVETVKSALVKNKAPIQVIYNHEGYWHSVFIVGFDDQRDSRRCGFVESSMRYFSTLAKDWSLKAANVQSEKKRNEFLRMAKDLRVKRAKIKASYEQAGGCRGQGVFYVRNSEFYGSDGLYDYDVTSSGEESPYAPRIMLFEYEWLEHLANHVIQIRASF